MGFWGAGLEFPDDPLAAEEEFTAVEAIAALLSIRSWNFGGRHKARPLPSRHEATRPHREEDGSSPRRQKIERVLGQAGNVCRGFDSKLEKDRGKGKKQRLREMEWRVSVSLLLLLLQELRECEGEGDLKLTTVGFGLGLLIFWVFRRRRKKKWAASNKWYRMVQVTGGGYYLMSLKLRE